MLNCAITSKITKILIEFKINQNIMKEMSLDFLTSKTKNYLSAIIATNQQPISLIKRHTKKYLLHITTILGKISLSGLIVSANQFINGLKN